MRVKKKGRCKKSLQISDNAILHCDPDMFKAQFDESGFRHFKGQIISECKINTD